MKVWFNTLAMLKNKVSGNDKYMLMIHNKYAVFIWFGMICKCLKREYIRSRLWFMKYVR